MKKKQGIGDSGRWNEIPQEGGEVIVLLCDWDHCGEGDLYLVAFLCVTRREGTRMDGPELSGAGLAWP